MLPRPPRPTPFPYTTLFRSRPPLVQRDESAPQNRMGALSSHSQMASIEAQWRTRSEEHTSELQSLRHLVCRLLLEKKNHVRIPCLKWQPKPKQQNDLRSTAD